MKHLTRKVLLVALCFTILLTGFASDEGTWQEQYDLGVRYLAEGNYQEAILAFNAAIEVDPKNAQPYIGRAKAIVLSGETEENLAAARADYQEAADLGDTSEEVWLGLADVYIREGDYDKALEILKEGLEKTGGNNAIAQKIAELESGTITDNSGKIRRESKYDASGELMWYHEYTYDVQGRVASVTAYNSSGIQIGYLEYRYTSDGRSENGLIVSSETGEISELIYEYDSAGNVTSVFFYDTEGNLTSQRTWEYDTEGNVIRENIFGPDGVQTSYTTYEYSENSEKTSSFGANGEMNYYMIQEYDDQGFPQKQSFYSADGTLEWYEITERDESGVQSTTRYNGDGTVKDVTVYG